MFHGRKNCLPPRRGSRLPLLSAAVVLATVLVTAVPSNSTTIRVKPDGSGDFPTIQAAINSAANGDTVLLETGTFTGTGNKNLDTQGKAITITSVGGVVSTVIDCEGSGRGFFIHTGEDSNTILTGIQIKNGHPANEKGGGIYCVGSSPRLIDDMIVLCRADSGSGAFLSNSNTKFVRTRVEACGPGSSSMYASGGGFCCRSSDLQVIDCDFVNNGAPSGSQQGTAFTCVNSTVRVFGSVFDGNVSMNGPVVNAQSSALTFLGNDFTNNVIEGSTLYLVGGTADVQANLFDTGPYSCGTPASVYAPAYGSSGPVDVKFNCFWNQGNFYTVGIHDGEISRNIFADCHGAVLGWEPNLTVVTNNDFYHSAHGCLTSAVDIEGYPDVMARNIHVGLPTIQARYATSCAYQCTPGTPVTEYAFVGGYAALDPYCWMVGCGKLLNTADPQFCDPENGNFFLSSTSPCLVENDPTLGATHGALPAGCGVEDVLDVTIPPEQFVREYEKGDVIPLTGFQVTNTSNMETIVKYALTCEGPVRLSDQGNPFALKGTSPVLQPGESYTPPEAAIVVTTDDEWFDVTVQYASAYAPALLTPDTQTMTILFRRTVPVLLKAFEAAYDGDAVRLQWSVAAEDAIEGWRIYRRPDGTDAQTLITATELPEDSREYRDDGIAEAGRYSYDLVALIEGREQAAGTVTVTTASPGFVLRQNIPNPFATTTAIGYAIPERTSVSLAIYDAAGRQVRSLVDAVQDPRSGGYSVYWDGKNDRGEPVASGVYVYRLKAGNAATSKKMMLLR
jgi:hypothetical protein